MAMANEYNTIFLYPCSIKREKLIDVFSCKCWITKVLNTVGPLIYLTSVMFRHNP